MSRSPEELERQAEQVRAEMAATAETIENRLTPGQLMDELFGYFKDGDSALALKNLKSQVRDNPMALAMIGTGIAWLMWGNGSADGRVGNHPSGRAYRSKGRDNGAGDIAQGYRAHGDPEDSVGARRSGLARAGEQAANALGEDGSEARDSRPGAMSRASASVSQAAREASDYARDKGEQMSDYAHKGADAMTDYAQDGMEAVGERARRAGAYAQHEAEEIAAYARRTVTDILEREPLVLGAVGLAVGAAIGAMMPSTRYEDEHLGPVRDNLRDSARETVKEGAEAVRDVAEKSYAAAKSEADRQGLTPREGQPPLADKASRVVKAAAEKGKSEAKSKMQSSEKNAPTTTPSPGGSTPGTGRG